MKKSEIKNGAIVIVRMGDAYIKIDNTLLDIRMNGNFEKLNNYNDNLNHMENSDFDIIKVLNPSEKSLSEKGCSSALNYYNYREILETNWTWKRTESLLNTDEKKYLQAILEPCYIKEIAEIVAGNSELCIYFIDGDTFNLPRYEHIRMDFRGLVRNKSYTLKELGLYE